MARIFLALATSACALVAANVRAAGKLEVTDAWVRAAPPGAMMLAGYARLHNAGDEPVIVRGASSDMFGDVSLHESVESGGVERMRPLASISIAPGDDVLLAPGGKHLMLMKPQRALTAGTAVTIHFDTSVRDGVEAMFVGRDAAPFGVGNP